MENTKPRTLNELLKTAIAARRNHEVLRFKQNKQWTGITGDQLGERVKNVALGLHDLGLRKGDRAAILAESGPLWTIADYAILANGAVTVPIYPTQPVPQVEYILRESEPKLLLVSTPRQLRRVTSALKQFPQVRVVLLQPVEAGGDLIPFSDIEERGARRLAEEPEKFDRISADVQPGDLASIIYTSGTTGEPKGVMLTHANITFNAMASGAYLEIEPDNLMLSFLPLSHILERMVLFLCLYHGVRIVYAAGIESVAADMRDAAPTLMSTVPRLLEKIYGRMQKSAADGGGLKKRIFEWALGVARRSAEFRAEGRMLPPLLEFQSDIATRLVFGKLREAVGGRMKRMVSGGAALPVEIARVFTGAGIPLLQGYGLTETSPVIAVNTLSANRIGSVGRPLPGVEVKIADDGEILTRGPNVFEGYFNKPEETQAAFTDEPDGQRWFKTGDIGRIDQDGFLFITDRKKDLIKTSAGKYVAPQMIENMINQSEFIEQSIVVGADRKYVSVLIVPDFERVREWARGQGIAASEKQELAGDRRVAEMLKGEVDKLTRELADYEKVKRVAIVPNEFTIDGGELTPTLKVRRRAVEAKYKGLIDSIYSVSAE